MSAKLRSIARQLKIGEPKPPAPAPAPAAGGGLGAALEAMIEQHLTEYMTQHARPAPAPALPPQVPPVPTPQAPAAQPRPLPTMRGVRDELGRLIGFDFDGVRTLNVQRDALGRASALVPAENAAPTPPTRQEQIVLDYEKSRDAPAPKPSLGLPTQRHDPVPDYEKTQR